MGWNRLLKPLIATCWVIAFHVLFYWQTLYNSGDSEETRLGRTDIWLASLFAPPRDGANLLVDAALRLSHVENLWPRLPIYLFAAAFAIASLALGDLLKRAIRPEGEISLGERIVVAFGLGAGTILLLTQWVGLGGWLTQRVSLAFLAAPVIAWLVVHPPWRWRLFGTARSEGESEPVPRTALVLAMAPFVILALLAAALPTTDFDAHAYHLLGPKEYWQAGRISFLPHNVYTTFPFATEMIHLLAMTALDDWQLGGLAGQAALALFGPATALAVGVFACRLFGSQAGWFAAFVYLTTPWTYRLMIIPYVEGALLFFTVLAIHSAVRSSNGNVRWAVLAGSFAGLAIGCKYPAVLMAALPSAVVVAWQSGRRQLTKTLIAWLVGAAVFAGPWLIRNTVWTGNPVYPLLFEVFGGANWSAEQSARFDRGHRPSDFSLYTLWRYIGIGWQRHSGEIPLSSDWQSSLVFAFAPLALLSSRHRTAWRIWLLTGYLFAVFWLLTHRLDRFWLPLEPFLAALAGTGIATFARSFLRTIVVAVVALSVCYNLVFCTTPLCGLNQYTADISQQLKANLSFEPAIAVAETLYRSQPECTVLFVGFAAVYQAAGNARYSTAFNENLLEQIARQPGADGELRPASEIRKRLQDKRIDFVLVDWNEIRRYRAADSYGFSAFISRSLFDSLCELGVLEEIRLYHRTLKDGQPIQQPLHPFLRTFPSTSQAPLSLFRVVDEEPGG